MKTRAAAAREQARTAALWTYNRVAVAGKGKAGGTQLSFLPLPYALDTPAA